MCSTSVLEQTDWNYVKIDHPFQTNATLVALKIPTDSEWSQPGPYFQSNHLKGNKAASSLHTIALFLVAPQSPAMMFLSMAVA